MDTNKTLSKDGDVTVRLDDMEILFLTTEIPTHDGKHLLVGVNNDYYERGEIRLDVWLCDRSYINDELVTDIESEIYDQYTYQDFVDGQEIITDELKSLTIPEMQPYFDEIKTSFESMIKAIDANFDFEEEEEYEEEPKHSAYERD